MRRCIRTPVLLAVTLATLLPMAPSSSFAQLPAPRVPQGPRVATLSDQLVSGLLATRLEQKEFIAEVVKAVNQNRLDRRLVNAVFVWSRRRWPPMPFPYFERAMRIEAGKRGVNLPSVRLVVRP